MLATLVDSLVTINKQFDLFYLCLRGNIACCYRLKIFQLLFDILTPNVWLCNINQTLTDFSELILMKKRLFLWNRPNFHCYCAVRTLAKVIFVSIQFILFRSYRIIHTLLTALMAHSSQSTTLWMKAVSMIGIIQWLFIIPIDNIEQTEKHDIQYNLRI